MLNNSNATNLYEPTTIHPGVHTQQTSRWYSCLWPVIGSITGLVFLALITAGAKGTVNMTFNNPMETSIFFVIFSFAILLIFSSWKAIRTLVRPAFDANPYLRFGCGFASILAFLPGIALMGRVGILNMNGFPQAYNWLVILIHGVISIAIPVEIEQYLAKGLTTSSLNVHKADANKPMDRSGG